jgi:transposase-like protein
MADITSVDLARLAGDNLEQASPDLLRAMVKAFAEALMGAEADAACGAPYGQVSEERVNYRNGYRDRRWDTRAGTIELAIPRLRQGSYFPDWLLERRRRSEQALISVVATSYLLGVSTRRVEKLAETLGIQSLSKSQVPELAKSLDGAVEQFRSRPLDAGPYRFVQADAMTVRVREGGRTVLVHALIATGVNADGHREILGLEVTSAEDGAGWLAFFRGLVTRGLSGVVLVTSDAHPGLVAAIAATLPGASWQRCRTHYLRDLLTKVSKASQPWVATLVRTIFDQPDAAEVHAQFDRGRGGAGSQAARRCRAPVRGPRGPAGLHRRPAGDLAASVVVQPARAAEQGTAPPHRRGRHLPRPARHHPPRRRGADGAKRRMGRSPPLHGPRRPRQSQRPYRPR